LATLGKIPAPSYHSLRLRSSKTIKKYWTILLRHKSQLTSDFCAFFAGKTTDLFHWEAGKTISLYNLHIIPIKYFNKDFFGLKNEGVLKMKKLLALGLSAVMVLGLAATVMAGVAVKGDLRYEFISDGSREAEDDSYDNPDLRLWVDAEISENLSAYLKLRYQPDGDTLTGSNIITSTDGSAGTKTTIITKNWTLAEDDLSIDEYFLTWDTNFATLKIGDFEYKVNPSRIVAQSNEYDSFTKADLLITGNIPFGNYYAGFAYAVAGSKVSKKISKRTDVTTADYTVRGPVKFDYYSVNPIEDGAYDICLGYKTDTYGLEFHAFDTKTDDPDSVATSVSYDAWYKPSENIKLFSYGNQAAYGDDSDADLNPVVGVLFTRFFSDQLQAGLEYALNENNSDYTPYGIQLIYNFNNHWGLELEHSNVTEDDDKTVCRFSLKF
jgi:hypothetical protein